MRKSLTNFCQITNFCLLPNVCASCVLKMGGPKLIQFNIMLFRKYCSLELKVDDNMNWFFERKKGDEQMISGRT